MIFLEMIVIVVLLIMAGMLNVGLYVIAAIGELTTPILLIWILVKLYKDKKKK